MTGLLSAGHYKARLGYLSRGDKLASEEELDALRLNYRAARLAERMKQDIGAHDFTPEHLQAMMAIVKEAKWTSRNPTVETDACFDGKHGACQQRPDCDCSCHLDRS